MIIFEGVHPLEGGAFRLKFRRDRRHGMQRENPFVFYPRYGVESVRKLWGYWRVYRQFKAMLDEALAAPDRWTYTDLAIAPPQAGRVRGARALSRDQRRRGRARPQAPRRCDPRAQSCARPRRAGDRRWRRAQARSPRAGGDALTVRHVRRNKKGRPEGRPFRI